MANYLLVNYNFFPFAAGGTEHYVMEQARYLKARGHEVVVMAPIEKNRSEGYTTWYVDNHVKIYTYEFESQLVWGVQAEKPKRLDLYKKDSSPLKNSFYNFFKSVAGTYPFSNLELHAFTACFGIHFLHAFRMVYPTALLRYYHHIPINCPKHTLEKSGRECRVTITKDTCTACIQHTFQDEIYLKWFDALNPIYLSFLPASLNRKHLVEFSIESFNRLKDSVREIIVFSEDMVDRIHSGSDSGDSGEGTRVRMVRHGIKPSLFEGNSSSRDSSVVIFSYLGRIEKIKGILTLAKAWNLLPVLPFRKLRIAGELSTAPEELKQTLVQLSEREDVELMGYLKNDTGSFLRSTHCLIVPSEWYETGPMVIHEAIASGANIIGSDIGGVGELCHYYHQTIFTAFDEHDLAGKIKEFRYNGPIGKKPESYESHFSRVFETV